MKLRNKKTGAIYSIEDIDLGKNADGIWLGMTHYGSLSELNEEWCDHEEPENFYIVEQRGTVGSRFRTGDEYEKKFKEIGNYFETKEEAEKALGKLKAWKRLKDNGFKFTAYQLQELNIKFFLDHGYTKMGDDLDLLFGGEE